MMPAAVQISLHQQSLRWLVTGGAGFIGAHLVEWLLAHGQIVRVLDDFSTGSRSNLDDVRARVGDAAWARFELVEGDVRDREACDRASIGVERVLHQAAIGSVPRSIADPEETHAVNVDGTVNVFLAARAAGARTVVYASSSAVYGDHPGVPAREPDIGRPLSPYAASKRVAEIYGQTYARAYGLRAVGLRYFNVVGARQDPQGPYAAVVPRWIAALHAGERPVIYGDGETSRDFCPVQNVVAANVAAALCGDDAMGAVFNVAMGQRTTLRELFAMLRDAMATRGVPCSEIEPVHEDFRPGDIRSSVADIGAARQAIGYDPQVSVAEGLGAAIDGYLARAR